MHPVSAAPSTTKQSTGFARSFPPRYARANLGHPSSSIGLHLPGLAVAGLGFELDCG
jgi:hypothetical protein